MKNLILSLIIAASFLGCADQQTDDIYERKFYNVKLVVYGNCPVVKIQNDYYSGLEHSDYEYERNIQLDNKVYTSKNISYSIEKMTNDSTIVSYELLIDNVVVLSDSSIDPSVIFDISYKLNY